MRTTARNALALLLLIALPAAAESRLPVRGRHAMVASVDAIASRIGADVLKRGGNAVDAAVAVAFALAVTWPEAGNLGGGGFMLVRDAHGGIKAIDYRETAPAASTRDMYLDAAGNVTADSTLGYRASGVPGTVAGLALAHKRYGKLPWATLLEPARKLAGEGFVVSEYLDRSLTGREAARMKQFPESWKIYGGHDLGDRLVQPELAATLARLARDPSDFYRGTTAKRIVAAMKAHGGLITAADLANYKPIVREPLRGTYRGYEIVCMPPPSSGGIALIEMLNMLESYDLQAMGWHSSEELHILLEVMRRAYADRAKYLGDPDFARVPVAGLISRKYAEERRRDIDPAKATDSKTVGAGDPTPYESPSTTHFTIVDRDGMIVTSTYTLNDSFGSAVSVAGFLLNDEMDDFASRPGTPNLYGLVQGEANAIAPHKRPLSSMTPTIVLKDGKPVMALGSPGGATIINAVLQVIVNVVDFGMNLQQAVDAPRIHHQWLPDEVGWEAFELPRDTWDALVKMGYVFHATPGLVSSKTPGALGDVHAVMIDADGTRLGASDPRRGGVAVGW
jgi:gamma-glutamyltranspeptidase/glutathione hydrolase